MAVKQVTRYEATDGTLFTDERAAQKYQDSLNTVGRDVFRKETFEKFITTQLDNKDEGLAKLYKRLVKDDLTFDESQPFFERVWLGTIKDTKLNQQPDYLNMLNEIIDEEESHIKADGVYDFAIGLGAKALMTRSKEQPYSLSTGYDGETYTLQASPGGFRMTNSKGAIGTSTFIDNRWTVVFKEVTHVVRWQAAMGK
jgi:hypothetical protein